MTFGDALGLAATIIPFETLLLIRATQSCAPFGRANTLYGLGSALTRAAQNLSMAFCSHNTFMSHTCLLEGVRAIGMMISHADTAVKALVLEISPH